MAIMALQQYYLGAQHTPLHLPYIWPSSYPTAQSPSTFQYLPSDAAESWSSRQVSSQPAQLPIPTGNQNLGDHPRSPSRADFFRSRSSCRFRGQPIRLSSFFSESRSFLNHSLQLFQQLWSGQPCLSSKTLHAETPSQSAEGASQSDEDSPWEYSRPRTAAMRDTLETNETNETVLAQIPQYVIEHAPLVHLYSEEAYWPCDVREHLYHITPKLNFTPVQASWEHPDLNNLNKLNEWEHGGNIYLTSNDNVEDHPQWLMGEKNIPAAPTSLKKQIDPADLSSAPMTSAPRGRSDAPAVLLVVEKGNGIVDAFWFFFYSYNLGNVVFLRFGNHVGDWEHTVVRFQRGKPKAVFVSEHFFGQAYSFQAVEKVGKRPVVYSAAGSHAMYATPGIHSYILPFGLLHDETDKGPLWDPALNSHMYTYDVHRDVLRPSNFTPQAPTGWFHFAGHWGDKQYPLEDSRQYFFADNYHYVSGPLGPKFKNLGREKICQGPESEPCMIKNWLGGSGLRRIRRLFAEAEMEKEERDRILQQTKFIQ